MRNRVGRRGGPSAVLLGAPLLTLLVWLGAAPAHALEARALVDRNTITMEDVLGLTVAVRDGDGAVDTSAIRDFAVTDRGRTSSVQIVNTHMTREVRYRYGLTPLRHGTLTVPALTVGEGRDAAVTDPITVQVLPRRAGAAPVADVAVEAEVSDATPFVGQEIVYTFRLLAATQIADARYQAPSFEGFTATPLEEQRRGTTVRNGRELAVTELTYLLVPQRVGTLPIEPARLSCQVPSGGSDPRRRDPFGMFDDPFFRRGSMREKSLACQSVVVTAAALPPVPTGQVFSGLVGSFQLSAAVSPATVRAGESATVTLVVEGTGNVAEAGVPELGLPASFKVYPDDPETDLTRDAAGSRGTKRFRFALVSTEPGEFSLGPFQVLTFDPEAAAYRPLQAGPLKLAVLPGDGVATASPTAPPPSDAALVFEPRREVTRRGHDILDLYAGLDAVRPQRSLGAVPVLAALVAPVLLYLAVWGVTARRGRKPTVAEEMAARARRDLGAAGSAGDPGTRLVALRRAVVAAVCGAAGRRGESLTADEVRELLGETGAGEDRAAAIVALLGRIDAARYGGATMDEALLGDVRQAVRALARGAKS
ncbi:MAG: BatD family protein [Deferrisomatales bacterium]|nr:BatD family protein [Deferrisomatales bacterium]